MYDPVLVCEGWVCRQIAANLSYIYVASLVGCDVYTDAVETSIMARNYAEHEALYCPRTDMLLAESL